MARGTPTWALDPAVRKAVESGLTEHEIVAMTEACETHGVPHSRWLESANLRVGYVPTAVLRHVAALEAGGQTRNAAIIAASIQFRVPEGTIASWARRYGLDAEAA